MKVSVIIPYNEDRGGLHQAIRAAENQDGFKLGIDYEIIPQFGDFTVGKNINDAVKKAKGEYIKICAEDDELTENCLITLYELATDGYDLVCANAIRISPEPKFRGYWNSSIPELVSDLAKENTINGGTILYRKETMPVWDEDMWCAEEYDVSLRMAAAGLRFGHIAEYVFCYRMWRGQKSRVTLSTAQRTEFDMERQEYIFNLRLKYLNNHNKIQR